MSECVKQNRARPSFFHLVGIAEYYKLYLKSRQDGVLYYFAVSCSSDVYIVSTFLHFYNRDRAVKFNTYMDWFAAEMNRDKTPWSETRRLIGSAE